MLKCYTKEFGSPKSLLINGLFHPLFSTLAIGSINRMNLILVVPSRSNSKEGCSILMIFNLAVPIILIHLIKSIAKAVLCFVCAITSCKKKFPYEVEPLLIF
jgi:hypothetical protein